MLGLFGQGRFPDSRRGDSQAVRRWTTGSDVLRQSAPMRPLAFVIPLALVAGACALRGTGEGSQGAVNAKALGVSAGDFFERYGRPMSRLEKSDGTMVFDWAGGSTRVAAGPYGPEEKICRLLITTDKNGRIASAEIIRDAKGERQLSRCVEVLDR
jgi:hypothetical protein